MTLFIADPNDRVRQCLASLAACVVGIEVVGEAGDVQEAIGGIKKAKPDSVIVALQMSGGSGLDVLSAAKSANPSVVIILLTVDERPESRLECLALGADYIFEKSGAIKKIVTALVLLAHRMYQVEFSVVPEVTPNSGGHVSSTRAESDSSPLIVSVSRPRMAAFTASGTNGCLPAGVVSETTARQLLRQTPATSARFPPPGDFQSRISRRLDTTWS